MEKEGAVAPLATSVDGGRNREQTPASPDGHDLVQRTRGSGLVAFLRLDGDPDLRVGASRTRQGEKQERALHALGSC